MALRNKSKYPERAKVPMPLAIAEVYLCLVIVRYMLNFSINLFMDVEDAGSMSLRMLSILFSLVMILVSASSVIGIASARPKSWRKVMRTSVLLLIVNTSYEVLPSIGITLTGAVFDDLFLALMTALTIGVMLLPTVRRFYLPPMTENPPLTRWMGYIFLTPLFREADYEFVREETDPHDPPAA